MPKPKQPDGQMDLFGSKSKGISVCEEITPMHAEAPRAAPVGAPASAVAHAPAPSAPLPPPQGTLRRRRGARVPASVIRPPTTWKPDPLHSRIDRRFLEFHQANPAIYEMIVRFCRDVRKYNAKRRTSIDLIWGRLRWELSIEVNPMGLEDYKLNNDFRSRYARLVMAQEPDLDGIFEVRELTEGTK
jgi:hypothetical protein